MKIQIISIGKAAKAHKQLIEHYQKMTGWNIKNTEITYSRKLDDVEAMLYEASLIEKKLSKNSKVIALDVLGKSVSSDNFSKVFERAMMVGHDIDFIIGGAFGIAPVLLNKVDMKLSLSNMTFPHQLAKILLFEQIYRADSIIKGHPYHK